MRQRAECVQEGIHLVCFFNGGSKQQVPEEAIVVKYETPETRGVYYLLSILSRSVDSGVLGWGGGEVFRPSY